MNNQQVTQRDVEQQNDARFVELNRTNAAALAKKSNRTYDSEIKRFKNWVQQYKNKDALGIPSPGFPQKSISKLSVNTYYLENMAIRQCSRGYAEKAHLALNKLAIMEESPLAPDITKHEDTAEVIESVLTNIDDRHRDKKQEEEMTVDPHEDNPLAIINQEEISRVLMVKLAKASNWLDSAVIWAITSVTAARFNSVQRLRTGKIVVIKNLPPHGIETPHDGHSWESMASGSLTDSRLLGFLVPPYDQLKRRTNKRQEAKTECIGGYRHKRFERCIAGVCGFLLLEKLNQKNISFLKVVPNGYISWKDVPLFETTYSGVRKSFKEAMVDAGVPEWAKVTHMRKAATTFLTAQGLPPEIVKTITKHKIEVFIQSYVCELSIPVCTCLAGFLPNRKGDEYFVPRSMIGTPGDMNVEQICHLLFPDYERWNNEQRSDGGDKSKGAIHFLMEVIPFLSEVIVQDGIYWVKKFPNNPATRELISRMENRTGLQNYLDWAKNKRIEVENILKQRQKHVHDRESYNLETDAATIISTRQHELDREKEKIEKQKRELIEQEKKIEVQKEVQKYHEELLRQQYASFLQPPFNNLNAQHTGAGASCRLPLLQQHPPLLTNLTRAATVIRPSSTCATSVNQETEPNDDVGSNHNAQNEPVSFQSIRLLRTSANDALKPTILSLNSYSSLENLVKKRTLHLHDIILRGKKMKRDDWANAQTDPNNWSRLKILYQRVNDHQDSTGLSMEQSAVWLDVNERRARHLNMNQYLHFLKTDPQFGMRYSGKKRKR